MTGFCLQETILSSIYIYETFKILRTSLQPRTRTTMKQLIVINAVIICMDLGLLGLECASLYILETLLKSVIYSIKLKLEFAILGKLVKFVGATAPVSDFRNNSTGFASTMETKSLRQGSNMNNTGPASIKGNLARQSVAVDSVQSRRKSTRSGGLHDYEYDFARFEHVENISSLRSVSMDGSNVSPGRVSGSSQGDILEGSQEHAV
nr:hypothetical protein CFP56_70023 [Quercus suber]